MKNTLLLFSFTLAVQSLFAQESTLFALLRQHQQSPPALSLLQIDLPTGEVDTLWGFPEAHSVNTGSSAFDAVSRWMVFDGMGAAQDSAQFRFQVSEPGSLGTWPAFNSLQGRRYDLQQQRHIGWRKDVNQNGYHIYQQHLPASASFPLTALPALSAVQTGSEAFNSNDQRYYFIGRDAGSK